MKKSIVAFVIALYILFTSGIAYARPVTRPRIPASIDCVNGNCAARSTYQTQNAYWEGEATNFQVSNPGLSANGVSYFREIYMEGGVSALVEVGIIKWKQTGGGGICSNSTDLQYFYDAYNSSGGLIKSGCAVVPSASYNNTFQFKMGFFVTNGPGMYFEVGDSRISGFDNCGNPCFVKGAMTGYTLLGMQEDMVDYVSGHQVYGVWWTQNQFQAHGNGEDPWQYFGAKSSLTAPNPVQMYWYSNPQGSTNSGGTLFSCVYQSGSTCSYGS